MLFNNCTTVGLITCIRMNDDLFLVFINRYCLIIMFLDNCILIYLIAFMPNGRFSMIATQYHIFMSLIAFLLMTAMLFVFVVLYAIFLIQCYSLLCLSYLLPLLWLFQFWCLLCFWCLYNQLNICYALDIDHAPLYMMAAYQWLLPNGVHLYA